MQLSVARFCEIVDFIHRGTNATGVTKQRPSFLRSADAGLSEPSIIRRVIGIGFAEIHGFVKLNDFDTSENTAYSEVFTIIPVSALTRLTK